MGKININNRFKKSKCCNSTAYKSPEFYSNSMLKMEEVSVCVKCGKNC